MKKSIVLLVICLFGYHFATQAQLRKLPAAVTESFSKKFPTAHHVTWRDKISVFSATFEQEGKAMMAKFNSDGSWVVVEEKLALVDIPPAVRDGLNKSIYADWTLKEAVLVQEPEQENYYRLTVKESTLNKKYLRFNVDGRLIKETRTL